MEIPPAWLSLCAGNTLVTVDSLDKETAIPDLVVSYVANLSRLLNKQGSCQ